jgi:hypothetical protein
MYKNNFNKQKVMEQIKKNNQGYQASIGRECMYRTHEEETNMCLVGCFIPDDKYDEGMESIDAHGVINRFFLHDVMPMSDRIMQELQEFHDEELNDLCGNEFFTAIEQKLIDMEKFYC